MTSDPWTGARLGQNSDSPLGGSFLAEAVAELAPSTVPSFASQSARDTAFSGWKTNGNTPVAGMGCFTRADGRAWRLAADGATWLYAGGNPPPIAACTAGAGWSMVPARPLGVYRDASGLCHLVGQVMPNTTYNPQDGQTHTAAQLAPGYYPTTAAPGVATLTQQNAPSVILSISTSGLITVVGGTVSSIAANLGHDFDLVTFHPKYASSVPLS